MLQIQLTKGRLARGKHVINEAVPVHRADDTKEECIETPHKQQGLCREAIKGVSVDGGQPCKGPDMGTRQTLCGMVFLCVVFRDQTVHPFWDGVTSL